MQVYWLLLVLHTARHWEDLIFNTILITFLGFDLISRTTFNQRYYSCPPVEEVMSPFKTALPKVARVIQALIRKHDLEPYRQVISVSCVIWDWGLISSRMQEEAMIFCTDANNYSAEGTQQHVSASGFGCKKST